MIELITGKPGSGKTYLAVQRMMELPLGKYVVYHNIAGLNPDKFPEPSMIKQIPDDLKTWCCKERQIEWADAVKQKYGRPMLVIIDEAQMVFGEKDSGLKGWLSWHRHLGQDIWLIAQHIKMIHMDYTNLAEYEIRAVRSMVLNMLVYQYRMGGETFKTMRKRRDQRVFKAYRSFDQNEASKTPFKLIWWGAAVCALAVGGFFLIQYQFSSKASEAQAAVAKKGPIAVKESSKSNDAPGGKVKDPWDEISYAGVMGGKIMVQKVGSGSLMDLGVAVRQRYFVVSASANSAVIWLPTGERTINRVPLGVQGDEAEVRDSSLARTKRKDGKENGSLGGNVKYGN